MSGGLGIQKLGWIKIAPPVLNIDAAQGIGNPNIRCDSGAISIWDRNGENPRQWQYWRGIAGGWSPLFTFPDDYAGGVGWLFDADMNPGNPSFYTSEFLPASGSDRSSARWCRISADGTEQGNNIWWPPLAFLSAPAEIGLGGGFSPFLLEEADVSISDYDPLQSMSFVSLADRSHLYVPLRYNINDQIVTALVGFTPSNGLADNVTMVDLDMSGYVQNFAYPMFLYDTSGGLVDALSFHPSGIGAYGQLRFNELGFFQAASLGIIDFQFSGGSITGPFIVSGDPGTDYIPTYPPPITPTELRLKPENFENTNYFPNAGVPGYAWESVPFLTGEQLQQYAICTFDTIAHPTGGVHDDKAVVSPYRFSGAGPPDVLGIVYTPFAQGFQGLPMPVAFPADAVAPFYGMVWQGGVYLIDSHSPTQMFALAFTTVQFAGLYALVNFVKMGDSA